ncbi:hypothetical protein KC367_g2336 [Hortaea werneckii]|nr:hypothetical protein KC342_g329 [Hortaea werneckii]KAI7109860.1 hypothetical protein KC339_g441 [Hortaea werneckii]KAI7243480.1 hypothetical protein KC365_g2260 [Hortaea werneckii]KAI7307769.1 hypothetical protein KC315_g13661 [Hortaea werneckii]KAI7339001.1 hypothetical protein KC340_g765 [Hortaea werneckii]
MSLLDLPAELVLAIIEHVPPADHYSFARACKWTAACSREILKHHQKCAAEYRVISDILPLTVPRTLRAVITDPIAAFHVRSLEYWGCRVEWTDWQEFVKGGKSMSPAKASHLEGSWKWSEDEIAYLDRSVWESMGISWLDEEGIGSLSSGNDWLLKTALLAQCPRIEKFYVADCDYTNESFLHVFPWEHLLNCIPYMLYEDTNPWPTGFNNLRSVAINVLDDLREPGHDFIHDMHPWDAELLLLLPNIESLYLRGLDFHADDSILDDDEDLRDWRSCFPSGLKHLYLDSCMCTESDFLGLVSDHEGLESFAFISCRFGELEPAGTEFLNLMNKLACDYSSTLKSLVFDRTSISEWESLELDKGFCPPLDEDFQELRCITVDFHGERFTASESEFADRLQKRVPSKLEHLRLVYEWPIRDRRGASYLNSALSSFLKKRGPSSLKSIDIREAHRSAPTTSAYRQTRELCAAQGIDLITCDEEADASEHKDVFPKPVCKSGMETRPRLSDELQEFAQSEDWLGSGTYSWPSRPRLTREVRELMET